MTHPSKFFLFLAVFSFPFLAYAVDESAAATSQNAPKHIIVRVSPDNPAQYSVTDEAAKLNDPGKLDSLEWNAIEKDQVVGNANSDVSPSLQAKPEDMIDRHRGHGNIRFHFGFGFHPYRYPYYYPYYYPYTPYYPCGYYWGTPYYYSYYCL